MKIGKQSKNQKKRLFRIKKKCKLSICVIVVKIALFNSNSKYYFEKIEWFQIYKQDIIKSWQILGLFQNNQPAKFYDKVEVDKMDLDERKLQKPWSTVKTTKCALSTPVSRRDEEFFRYILFLPELYPLKITKNVSLKFLSWNALFDLQDRFQGQTRFSNRKWTFILTKSIYKWNILYL